MEIENDHNVYILGAGFSVGAGLPLTADLLNRMRDAAQWLRKARRSREATAIERVLEFRQYAAGAGYRVALNLEDVEQLFSLADAQPERGASDQVSQAIASTIDFARLTSSRGNTEVQLQLDGMPGRQPAHWTVEHQPEADGERTSFLLPTYDYYLGLLCGAFSKPRPGMRNSFITFNYDTLVEDALANLAIKFSYAFPRRTVNYESASCTRHHLDHEVDVFKLHGSLNWGVRSGQGRSFTVYRTYKDVLTAKAVPVLVPPTWRKAFGDQLTYVWNGAVHALRSATRVVIIGFSMPPTDLHFRYLLAAGLQENVSLRDVHVVDLDAEAVVAKLKTILRPETKVTSHAGGMATFAFMGDRGALGRAVEEPWFRTDAIPTVLR